MRCMEKHSRASGFRWGGGSRGRLDKFGVKESRREGGWRSSRGGCASRLVHAENWDRANENGSRATFIEIIVD